MSVPLLETYMVEHREDFYRLAYTYVRDPDAALDVVQNAIVQALTHADTLRRPAYLKTWFYRILINESLSYLRRWGRRDQQTLSLETVAEQLAGEEADAADRLDVTAAVDRLRPPWRTVVVLRFYEDMPLEEIARVVGAPLSTVKTRLYKALDQLERELSLEREQTGTSRAGRPAVGKKRAARSSGKEDRHETAG